MMEPFFETVLQEAEQSLFLRKVAGKYHYPLEERENLADVASKMMPVVRREAAWELKENEADKDLPYVVMTLGAAFDAFQEKYAEEGKLSEAYMMEAIASEMLLRGYEEFNRWIEENRKQRVERYFFFGTDERFPLQDIPKILAQSVLSVKCNAAYCIIPKKSVLFAAKLTENPNAQCEGICVGCKNIHCPNRMEQSAKSSMLYNADKLLNYGYSRIFNKEK